MGGVANTQGATPFAKSLVNGKHPPDTANHDGGKPGENAKKKAYDNTHSESCNGWGMLLKEPQTQDVPSPDKPRPCFTQSQSAATPLQGHILAMEGARCPQMPMKGFLPAATEQANPCAQCPLHRLTCAQTCRMWTPNKQHHKKTKWPTTTRERQTDVGDTLAFRRWCRIKKIPGTGAMTKNTLCSSKPYTLCL